MCRCRRRLRAPWRLEECPVPRSPVRAGYKKSCQKTYRKRVLIPSKVYFRGPRSPPFFKQLSPRQASRMSFGCFLKKTEMSRLRNLHCLPFLKAGRMFLRANSFTVSGLKSSITATCLLFNSSSSLSVMEPPLPEVDLQPRSVKKFFFSNKFTYSCQGKLPRQPWV